MDARHHNVCGIDTQLLISHEKASDVEMMKSARRRRAPAALQNTHHLTASVDKKELCGLVRWWRAQEKQIFDSWKEKRDTKFT